MAVVSTHVINKKFVRDSLISISTAYPGSSNLGSAAGYIGGMFQSTADTYIRCPISKPGNPYGFVITYSQPYTASTAAYAQVAVQLAPSSDGYGWAGTPGVANLSTVGSGFKMFTSTACFGATSTQSETFFLGPIDTAKFGLVTASSHGDVDKYQTYIRIMPGISTAAAGATIGQMATNVVVGHIFVMPIEFSP